MPEPEEGRNLIFIDIETTGHDALKAVCVDNEVYLKTWHEVIDIGAVLVAQKNLIAIGMFERKVEPMHPERCADYAAKVNDFPKRAKRGEWADAVPLSVALRELLAFATGYGNFEAAIAFGQNFTFDWLFSSVGFALAGIDERRWSVALHYARHDTRSIAVGALPPPGGILRPDDYSLRRGFLAKKLGVKDEPPVHEAINGALLALDIYRAIMRLTLDERVALLKEVLSPA